MALLWCWSVEGEMAAEAEFTAMMDMPKEPEA